MSGYRVLVCEARTGIVKDELKPSGDPSWSTEIGEKGDWSCELQLGVAPNFKDNVLSYTTSGAYFWMICYDDVPLQGGMPSSAGFAQGTNVLSVSGSGIGALFDSREVRMPNATPATIQNAANNWTAAGMSQRALMREIVVKSLGDSDSGASLPFDVSDGAGETGTFTQFFVGSDLTSVWSRLSDQTETDGGVEFIIRPYLFYTGNLPSIGFKLALGTPALGNLTLNALWESGAAFGNIDVDYNMSIPRPHRVWSKGSSDGGGVALIGYAENTAALQALGVPYADYVDTTHSDSKVLTRLNTFASAVLKEYSVPKETWTMSVRIDGKNRKGIQVSPKLGEWVEGDMPLVRVVRHPVIADGTYRRRIMGMSGGDPGTVNLKIQDIALA